MTDTDTTADQISMAEACRTGDLSTVNELLLTKNYDCNSSIPWKDKSGQELHTPPIFIAIDYSHIPIVEALLTTTTTSGSSGGGGVDVNAQDENGYSPLCWASWNGNLELVQLLISTYKATVHQTTLDLAREYNQGHIVSLLLQHINLYQEYDPINDVDDIMLKAAREGDTAKITELIDNGYDFEKWKDESGNYKQFSPMFVAHKCGHIDVIQLIMNAGGLELEMDMSQFDAAGPIPEKDDGETKEEKEIVEEDGTEEEMHARAMAFLNGED